MSTEDRTVLSTDIRSLRVKLTPEELDSKTQLLADELEELRQLRLRNAEAKKEMKSLEDYKQSHLFEVREDVKLRAELRKVDCEWVAFWDTNEAKLIRNDTGETVSTRPLFEHERQIRAFPFPARADSDREPQARVAKKTNARGKARVEDLDDDAPDAA